MRGEVACCGLRWLLRLEVVLRLEVAAAAEVVCCGLWWLLRLEVVCCGLLYLRKFRVFSREGAG
jgi:hypothetical protein